MVRTGQGRPPVRSLRPIPEAIRQDIPSKDVPKDVDLGNPGRSQGFHGMGIGGRLPRLSGSYATLLAGGALKENNRLK